MIKKIMKITYRPEIDGLRAIAVIAVIFYHAKLTLFNIEFFKGGFIGVDIFFVISGYLITAIIIKEYNVKKKFSFLNFYERRIRRILPALLFVMSASIPIAWYILLPVSFIDFSKSIIYSLGFSSNFYFHYSGQIYGADSGLLKPFLHTWSLSVEEQFYIIFPLIFLLFYKSFKKYTLLSLISLFILSLCFAQWGSINISSLNFYILPSRGWELLAGVILAFLENNYSQRKSNKFFDLTMPIIGITLIALSFIFFDDNIMHPSVYTLVPIFGVCLIIWFSNKDDIITKIISSKIFVGIGLISYSLYLWHYPIFAFLRYYGWIWQNSEDLHYKIIKLLSILLIFGLSTITYFFVEKKFRNKNFNTLNALLTISLIFSSILLINISVIFFSGFEKRFHPLLSKYKSEHFYFKGKYNYNNFNHRENVFILGNSYADDLLNLLYFNKDLNKKYYFYTAVSDSQKKSGMYKISCLLDFFKNKSTICDNVSNESQSKKTFSNIEKQYSESDLIILSEEGNSFYLKNEFYELIKYFEADNKNYIVYLDDVVGANLLDSFLIKFNKIPNLYELEDLERAFYQISKNYQKDLLEKIKQIFEYRNIKFITRSSLLCLDILEVCPLIKNNDKLYSDNGHLTNYGAKYFSSKGSIIFKKK